MINIQDIINDLIELDAYRILSGQSFDFGTGIIKNDSKISEDVYYKMQQQELEELLFNKNNYIPQNKNKQKKHRLNKYERKKITYKRLKKLHSISLYTCGAYEKNGRLTRFYLSGRKGYAKWCSDRKVRHGNKEFCLRGGGYRKVFDYWWTVY